MKTTVMDIVIVNYKSTDQLEQCLDSISNALGGMKARIFVEDNGSDDQVDRIKKVYPEVILHKNSANLGFAKAVNKAVWKGRSPYLLILNPDTIVSAELFSKGIPYMEKNPEVGVVGPMILDRDGSVQGSARSFPTPLTAFFGRRSLLTRWFPGNRVTRKNLLTLISDGKTPMEVDWVSGACMLAKRKAIEEIGSFDERFFLYWEDADLCKRLWQAGWKVIYFPSASIIHLVGASSERLIFRSILEFHKSSYRLLQKYESQWVAFLKPFVIGGLALRIVFALAMNRANKWYQRHKRQKVSKGKHRTFQRNGKPKVLRLISRLNIGGPAIHVSLLNRFLNRDKFESVLVYGTIPSHEGDMTYLMNGQNGRRVCIPELRKEINLLNDVRAMTRIANFIVLEKPDIVHTHTSKAGAIGRLAVLFHNVVSSRKIATVHTFHGNVFDGYFSRQKSTLYVWIERILAKVTNRIIAISESQEKELTEKFRIAPPAKIRKIGLGFELEPFLTCRTLKGRFRKKLGISDTIFLVGIIGRFAPIKNHVMFLRAARIFLKEHPEIPIRFLLVGDGELRSKLEGYCREQGLSDHVLFCGWVKNVVSVYADLDVLSLTSLNEGTPVSIIEAMASSVPVISTDAGGVCDLLGRPTDTSAWDGFVVCERGILCKRNHASGFANSMHYLLEEDEIHRKQRLSRACDFVKEKFPKERLLNDIEKLYFEMINPESSLSMVDRRFINKQGGT